MTIIICQMCGGGGFVTNHYTNTRSVCASCGGGGGHLQQERRTSSCSTIRVSCREYTKKEMEQMEKNYENLLKIIFFPITILCYIFLYIDKTKYGNYIIHKVFDLIAFLYNYTIITIKFLIKMALILTLITPIYKGLTFLFRKLHIANSFSKIMIFILMTSAYSQLYFHQEESLIILYKSIGSTLDYLNKSEYFLMAKDYFNRTEILSEINNARGDNIEARKKRARLIKIFPHDEEVLKTFEEYRIFDKKFFYPHVRGIPSHKIKDNLEGYQSLLILDPSNKIYLKKVELYKNKLLKE